MNKPPFSILMSLYDKENPVYFDESMKSILSSTLLPNEIILVLDGPINPSLMDIVNKYEANPILKTIPLPSNVGLGNALNIGLSHCTNNLVARMDTDDICDINRFMLQIEYMSTHDVDVISGTVLEFSGSTDNIVGKRTLPLTHEDIRKFARTRNPINHPAAMFKKDAVLSAGSYKNDYPLFEDYYLWARILLNGGTLANLAEIMVFMRVDDNTYLRRGGSEYAKTLKAFHSYLIDNGISRKQDYVKHVIPHVALCLAPNAVRKTVYKLIR